ncbi:MAG TPA: DUF4350 domain-containing protein [Candidatus Limnocylindria bacterium]|nr:DUF4350 domain-containing protein [Candidatus Limnocylindria bacterium]
MSASGGRRDHVWGDERSMFAAWLGVLVLAFAWLRGLPVFTLDSRGFGVWIAAGTALLILGCRADLGPRSLTLLQAALLGSASLAGVLLLPPPHQIGPLLLLGAAVLSLLPVRSLVSRVLPGLWVAGTVLALQAALAPILFILASRLHDAPLLTAVLYYPLKLLAPETVRTGSVIHMVTPVDSVGLTPSFEKLGLFPGVLAAAGFAVLVFLHPRGRGRMLGFVALCAAYAWLRLLILFLVVSRFRDSGVFWELGPMFLSFLPLPVALAAWWARGVAARAEVATKESETARPGFPWRVAFGALLVTAGVTLFFGYHDPGVRKQGRVLIDESHSDWEWTTQPFDRQWYGGRSGYNYYCLADFWSRHYRVETHRRGLTPEFLSQWDVVVIKTPTAPYSEAEIEAVADYVRAGGGLLLVGDHTNVFGSSTYLNPIAGRFGMYFRYDATYTLSNFALTRYQPPPQLPHPVVRNVPEFLFATSCSLDPPLLSENVILGYGLRGIYLDYSETSYFPTKTDKLDFDFGVIVQAGGAQIGKGRILLFTDSTVFSNFFMFIPGKPELALGMIDWLNRSNRFHTLRLLFLLLALIGLVLFAWGVRGSPRWHALQALVIAGLLGFVATQRACDALAARDYPLPQPRQPIEEIVFDAEHGDFLLPRHDLVYGYWNAIQTFYVWTQRIGLVPRVADRLEDALSHPGRALVEFNPRRSFDLQEIDGIVDFVRRGGMLVVIDTPENEESSANELLGPFQMSFSSQVQDSIAVLRPLGAAGAWLRAPGPVDTLGVAAKARAVEGAQPLLVLPEGETVMGYQPFGRGTVLAFGAGRLFSDEVMGGTATMPTPHQRALYQAEFDLFETIGRISSGPRYAGTPISVPAAAR